MSGSFEDEPPTNAETLLGRTVARILERTGLTREYLVQTPTPVLMALTLLLDEIDLLRSESGYVEKSPIPSRLPEE